MTTSQSTDPAAPRPEPFRWPRTTAADAFDHFHDTAPDSQRAYAREHDIPRSTLGYWLRRETPADLDADLDRFFRGTAGEAFLRRLVLAADLVFHHQAACGLRCLGQFFRLAQLDRWVAPSYGALHTLDAHLQADLATFGDEEQRRLAAQMTPRKVTLTGDENFHGPHMCLVAIEPVSNFLLVECYRDRRDADTWTQAIRDSLRDLPVEVLLLTSDRAKGLLRCAREGLAVLHSPDLFHGQRDLLRPLLLPLQRPIQQAQKELEKATQHTARVESKLAATPGPPARAQVEELIEAVRREQEVAAKLPPAQEHKEQAVQAVRGVGDDYHPFDPETGRPVTPEQVEQRLRQHVAELEKVAQEAGLGERPQEALTKAQSWLGTLVAVVAWFWVQARQQVEALGLSAEQEQVVYECLLAGQYWEGAAHRARDPEERQRLKALAERLQQEAWRAGGALAMLAEPARQEVARVARQCAGLFSRSSSCVEGRNGRLSLHHHGQGRLSTAKLKALTVVHNYVVKRADGTTAAERFFGVKPREAFGWLLERMPDLPRPAAKRPKQATQSLPKVG